MKLRDDDMAKLLQEMADEVYGEGVAEIVCTDATVYRSAEGKYLVADFRIRPSADSPYAP